MIHVPIEGVGCNWNWSLIHEHSYSFDIPRTPPSDDSPESSRVLAAYRCKNKKEKVIWREAGDRGPGPSGDEQFPTYNPLNTYRFTLKSLIPNLFRRGMLQMRGIGYPGRHKYVPTLYDDFIVTMVICWMLTTGSFVPPDGSLHQDCASARYDSRSCKRINWQNASHKKI